VVVAVKIVALVTLKFPLSLEVPTTVISSPTAGALPDSTLKVNVAVVVDPESEMTGPVVGLDLSSNEPKT